MEDDEGMLQRIDDVIRVLKIVSDDLASISGTLKWIAKDRIQEAEAAIDRPSTSYDDVNAQEEFEKDQDDDSSDEGDETMDDLPIGYEDILHPEGDDDYDTDDAR